MRHDVSIFRLPSSTVSGSFSDRRDWHDLDSPITNRVADLRDTITYESSESPRDERIENTRGRCCKVEVKEIHVDSMAALERKRRADKKKMLRFDVLVRR